MGGGRQPATKGACAAETFPGFSHPPSGMRSSLSESSQSTQGNVVCRKSRSLLQPEREVSKDF